MLLSSRNGFFSFLVFLFSITVSILTIIPTLFPALYTSEINPSMFDGNSVFEKFYISSLEPGLYFTPIIITSGIVFGIIIILKLKSIKIPTFNVSNRVSIIGLVIILVIFTALSYEGVISPDHHEDWKGVKSAVESWPPDEINFQLHVRYFLLSSSFLLFGNYRVIPFLASASLLVLSYLFTYKITNNRVSGLLSCAIILQSNLFLSFASTPSYTVFWTLFYVTSIYLVIHKAWILSPASFVLSLFSKPLTVTFFPLSIFFVLNADIPLKRKIITSVITSIIIIVGASVFAGSSSGDWDWSEFWIGFTSFSYQMRFDALIVVFLIPIIVGLFFVAKNNRYANSISIMISGILITNPFLLAMTDITSQPYRFIPLVIFFAIGVGMIISNQSKSNQSKSNQSKSNQSKSNQSKSNQSKSNQSKSNQSKSNQSKSKKY